MGTLKNLIGNIREWIAAQDRKKLIENTAIVIIVGMIIIIAGSAILSRKPGRTDVSAPQATNTGGKAGTADGAAAGTEAGDIETRLQTILSQVQGAGKVDVMITFSDTGEKMPAYDIKRSQDETDEKDSAGGTRKISKEEYESSLAYEDSPSGGKEPVILRRFEPEIRGVLVVADGADNVEVRDRICKAVTVVLDVPPHRVQVVQRKK